MIEWSDDGCPNNCGYCKKHKRPCIYTSEGDYLRERPYTCAKCGKKLAGDEAYSYKDYTFCENCFDDGIEEVEELIQKANENIDARTRGKVLFPPFLADEKEWKDHKELMGRWMEVAGKESIYEKKLKDGELL